MVLADLELALGEDHPLRRLAPELALLDHEPAGHRRTGEDHGDRGSRAEVPRAADDRARLALPHVDLRQLQLVRVGVLARLEDLADAEVAEVAVDVRHAAAPDVVDLARRNREPLGQLAERHLDRDIVP